MLGIQAKDFEDWKKEEKQRMAVSTLLDAHAAYHGCWPSLYPTQNKCC